MKYRLDMFTVIYFHHRAQVTVIGVKNIVPEDGDLVLQCEDEVNFHIPAEQLESVDIDSPAERLTIEFSCEEDIKVYRELSMKFPEKYITLDHRVI